jgi:hypothetical protein
MFHNGSTPQFFSRSFSTATVPVAMIVATRWDMIFTLCMILSAESLLVVVFSFWYRNPQRFETN